jgi:hypothetical protein
MYLLLFTVNIALAMNDQTSFNQTINHLRLAHNQKTKTDDDFLIEDLFSIIEHAIKLENKQEEKSTNNGLIALLKKALEELRMNPEVFISKHHDLSTTIFANIAQDPEISQAFETAKQKTQEAQCAWTIWRKKAAYKTQAYLEEQNPEGTQFPKHEPNESHDNYSCRYIAANKMLELSEKNYNHWCAAILTLLTTRNITRKELYQNFDVLKKIHS